MNVDQSLWSFFAAAGPIVKFVMLFLLAISFFSWTCIFQRGLYLRDLKRMINAFEEKFWSGVDVVQLFMQQKHFKHKLQGTAAIFQSGFEEYERLLKDGASGTIALDASRRAMGIAQAHEEARLEKHLSFLATIGSTSPYIGLFGTVWGIMNSFRSLGHVQQASIAMVAPGISEALVATAMGLFAAIPAVIAYNRYSSGVDALLQHYDTFQDELYNILQRQLVLASKH